MALEDSSEMLQRKCMLARRGARPQDRPNVLGIGDLPKPNWWALSKCQ